MIELRNQILHGDCVEILRQAQEPFADLVFTDPPFNIGYKHDKYHDKKASAKYLAWTEDWIGACVNVLKPHGSFYLAIGDEYVAHIKLILDAQGLPVEGEGRPDWPEHAEAELCWLYGENKVPYKELCTSAKLLSLLTGKLNDRSGKSVLYTPDEVIERLGQLERGAKLAAHLSDRVNSI